MKFHILYVSSVSACFELENSAPYYAEQRYDVTLNGSPALLGVRTNVFCALYVTESITDDEAFGGDKR